MQSGSFARLITTFVRHPVAANLLMLAVIVSGAWSLTRLNVQFFPTFHINYITINVVWRGASAEDVERSITIPLEQGLRTVDYLKEIKAKSQLGFANISIEFEQGANMTTALEQVKEKISQVRNLPQDAETPVISKVENFELIARILISGPKNIEEMRPWIYQAEQNLLQRGIAKVTINGLPEKMIAIQVPTTALASLHMSLNEVADRVALRSKDLPAGTIGREGKNSQLRSIEQRRSILGFETLPLVADNTGNLIRLGDIAKIEKKSRDDEITITYKGKPAIELALYRTETANSLKMAKIMKQWLHEVKPGLPPGVKVTVYNQRWQAIVERINVLIKNGIGGFILILILLFLFLNYRVAFWVGMGIPLSILAALTVLVFLGGSINMISLFAIIMSLGIIVDDTIVVGEEALTQLQNGLPVRQAVEKGTKKMLVPVMSSSLTTVAAFLPLFMVGDIIGAILKTIPLVVICVIVASLLECFFILPGHLSQSFRSLKSQKMQNLRGHAQHVYEYCRDHIFRQFVTRCLHYRLAVISSALVTLLIIIGLFASGRVNFTFFPSPEHIRVEAEIEFMAGTSAHDMSAILAEIEKSLWQTNDIVKENDKDIVLTNAVYQHMGGYDKGKAIERANIKVELTSPDTRQISNKAFIAAWRDNIKPYPQIASLLITQPRAGPPGEDIDIKLYGNQPQVLKKAALALQHILAQFDGVSDITDDLPYGQEQLLYSLKPEAKAIGLTINDVGEQLRAAFTGHLAQIYHEDRDEIEVRVMLPDHERKALITLEQLPIITANGDIVPLGSVVSILYQRGFDVLPRNDANLAVRVLATVDAKRNNTNKIIRQLEHDYLPALLAQYQIQYDFKGSREEQSETLTEMKYGVYLALALIYIILAWVFASYAWPFIVMAAIPFGIIGAVFGHWIMGQDLTILSLFGLFGLSGIVINDSIILLTRYQEIIKDRHRGHEAIVEASCQRFRAVLLTSITTIGGLTPLLFETSLQAQFLKPMAISISFGLAFSTLIILVLVPVLLSFYEDYCTSRQ